LGDVLNSPIGASYKSFSSLAIATEGESRSGQYYIGQGHLRIVHDYETLIPTGNTINPKYLTDEKIVFTYRDPRDVIVSFNYYREINNIHEAIKIRGHDLVDFYRMWLDSDLPNVITNYEKLLKNNVLELTSILKKLEINCSTNEIAAASKRQSFANRVQYAKNYGDSLNYGKDFQLKFLRRGIVGDWRNHFDDKAIEMCNDYFGELMKELGYIDNLDWWKSL